jgi:predicted Zn-dependent protease
MIKLLKILVIMLFCVNAYALTFNDAEEVYKQLVIKNHVMPLPKLAYWPNDQVNAFCDSDAQTIVLTRGILKFVQNKDQLAMVIGHELGHCILHHPISTPRNEYIADRMGYWLSQAAGYNVCKGVEVLKNLNDPASATHPASINRYNVLKCK